MSSLRDLAENYAPQALLECCVGVASKWRKIGNGAGLGLTCEAKASALIPITEATQPWLAQATDDTGWTCAGVQHWYSAFGNITEWTQLMNQTDPNDYGDLSSAASSLSPGLFGIINSISKAIWG
jgi:hypothetical protein